MKFSSKLPSVSESAYSGSERAGDDQRRRAARGVLVLPDVDAAPTLVALAAAVDQRQVVGQPLVALAADGVGEAAQFVDAVPGGQALENPCPLGVRTGVGQHGVQPLTVSSTQVVHRLAGAFQLCQGQDAVVERVADAVARVDVLLGQYHGVVRGQTTVDGGRGTGLAREVVEPGHRAVRGVQGVGVDVDAAVDQVVDGLDQADESGRVGHREVAADGDVRSRQPVRGPHLDPGVGRVVQRVIQAFVQVAVPVLLVADVVGQVEEHLGGVLEGLRRAVDRLVGRGQHG